MMDWDVFFAGVRRHTESARMRHPVFAGCFSLDALRGISERDAARVREANGLAEELLARSGENVLLAEMLLREEIDEAGAECERGNVERFREELLDAIAVLARAWDEAERLVEGTRALRGAHSFGGDSEGGE